MEMSATLTDMMEDPGLPRTQTVAGVVMRSLVPMPGAGMAGVG